MRRGKKDKRFYKRLESERPEPSDEFMSKMTGRLTPMPVQRASGWRVALVGGFTALLVLAFALTGGIGYAASAVKDSTVAVKTLVVGPSKPAKAEKSSTAQGTNASSQSASSSSQSNSKKGNQTSSARKQYQDKVVICHRPPGSPENAHTISVAQSAVPAHVAHGDTLGPCPNGR